MNTAELKSVHGGHRKKSTTLDPAKDGEDHINIWISGKTELGKKLHQFYKMGFKHPYFGPFACMEGFWQYIRTTGPDRDALRKLTGKKAKDYGNKLPKAPYRDCNEILNTANFYKIEQNKDLHDAFVESTLPFACYYLHGPGNLMIVPPPAIHIVNGFEEIRKMFKEERRPISLDYSSYI